MSEALRRITDAVADVTEEELAEVLGALGAQRRPQKLTQRAVRTPLPLPGGSSNIRSEVEWI
ncbi:hypothetical protein AQJ67_21155 [Streptomyces caeruleatus]|uniref:Uncharacterized protein n=1 Tax=Streptomyces caeruleatus TaxID=661399 RepID=A0A117RPP1_9ACTN|nr:hypothetical protein AQJ67_21155 [Streptomyces caeruleatus]